MNNTGDSPRDEQQSANMTTDYRALLLTTRPLIVTEHTLLSWRGGELYRSGFGMSLGTGDWSPESTLSRGEVIRSHEPGPGIAQDEELATTLEEAGICSPLQIRICIGMS